MMQVPTNYKMGSGLAATIMGQQAGLEAEQQGLANLYKAAETPTKMLEGAKAMDLLNNPEYMKATEQWQTAAAQGKVSEEQSKKAYNDLTLLVTQLQAYSGDIGKQREIMKGSLMTQGVPLDSPMAQLLMEQPLDRAIMSRDQVGQTLSKTPEHLGKMEERKFMEGEHWKRTQAEIAGRAQNAAVTANAGVSRMNEQERREINRARRGLAFKDPVELEQGLTTALDNNVDPITFEPLTPETRAYYTRMRSAATTAVAKKQKTISFNFGDGTTTATSPAPAPATGGSTAKSEAESKGF